MKNNLIKILSNLAFIFVIPSCHYISGGTDPRIACKYSFYSHGEFIDFYEKFVTFNVERYLVPVTSEDIDILYCFDFGGVQRSACDAKGSSYYEFQNLTIDYNDLQNDINLQGTCFPIYDSQGIDDINFSYSSKDGFIYLECFDNLETLLFRGKIYHSVEQNSFNSFLTLLKKSFMEDIDFVF